MERAAMSRRLAINELGDLTYCSSDEEHVGKGRCNHTTHQPEDVTNESFMRRVQIINNMPNEEEKNAEILNVYYERFNAGDTRKMDVIPEEHSERTIRNIMKFRPFTSEVEDILKTHGENQEAQTEINKLFPGKSWIVGTATIYPECGFDEDGIPYNENGITYFRSPEDNPDDPRYPIKAFTSNGDVLAKDLNFDDYDILMFERTQHRT